MSCQSENAQRRRLQRGLSLVEVTISTLLVGLVLVASLRSVGHVMRSRGSTSAEARAAILAEQLMTEILNEDYEEPVDPPEFGRESGESGGSRENWDDVDDYHLWDRRPPEDRDGNPLPNSTDWQRDVTVQFVNPADPSGVSGSDQGVKRITVNVWFGGEILAQSVALRSDEYVVP